MFALIKLPFKLLSLPLMAVFSGFPRENSQQSFRVCSQSIDSFRSRLWRLFCGMSAMEPRFSPWYY